MFKKIFSKLVITLFLIGSFSAKSIANELTFFTIGTGGTAYTYYPVGGMIANAISNHQDPESVVKVEVVELKG